MATQSIPIIPPRPSRTQEPSISTNSGSTLGSDIPKIPPRPINRRIDRSQSPHRESFARSPLNDPSFVPYGSVGKSSLSSGPSEEVPRRPTSIILPSLGQEGSEYAEAFSVPEETPGLSPTHSRTVANDLQLHAPKPSLPTSSAKQRVSAVTRTDSGQAAALGIGKASSDDKDPHLRSIKAKSSFASQDSTGTERPYSSSETDPNGPEDGQRVPMYPNAGIVQAPSPSPFSTPFQPGIGFHNDGSKPRHHGRKTSNRGFEGPPGSYGLHGHGIIPKDRFEQAYYEKHPELLKKETGHYSGAIADSRNEWAMSSEDLNKIVRDTASRGAGLGTSPAIMGTPTEQIGFIATEEYTSRMSSPRLQSATLYKTESNTSDNHLDSPLRKESFPADVMGKTNFEQTLGRSIYGRSDAAVESEYEDDDVVHVDDPNRRPSSRMYAGSAQESTDDLGAYGSNAGDDEPYAEEHGYNAPILASDEVAKDPFGYDMQPAVSPTQERHGFNYDNPDLHHRRSSSASSLPGSRPSSRPVSIHGVPGINVSSDYGRSTPLEDLHEYEPLFPEDEKSTAKVLKEKPISPTDRLKARPEFKSRRFPSQDIWEDTPQSLQHTATVSTPQLPEDVDENSFMNNLHAREGETPEQAFARRQEELAEHESQDSESFLNREKKPWAHNSTLMAETRPGLKQRFPSRDIWEDSPDSLQLQTTVSAPQSEEQDVLSQPEERPTTGAVAYHQEKSAAGLPLGAEEGRATTGILATLKPSIPARPTRQTSQDDKASPIIPSRPQKLNSDGPSTDSTSESISPTSTKAAPPAIPEKSKPQVPARPTKPIKRDSTEGAPLATTTSGSSVKSIGSDQSSAAAKPKPPVPSRPIGSKIAALQGGFMSDLNKRLQLGPQAPKKEEPQEEVKEESEKAPLVDARKGRARGPVRRAPAKSPTPAVESKASASTSSALAFSSPSTLWSIDPDDDTLKVEFSEANESFDADSKAAHSSVPTLTTNTAGQTVHTSEDVAPIESHKSGAVPSSAQDSHAQQADHARKEALMADVIVKEPTPDELEDLSASTATITPDTKDEISQTGELIIHTNTGVGNEHPTAGTKERLVAYVGGQAPDDGDVVVKESAA